MASRRPPFTHAVIMGDLVRSEAANAPMRLHRIFNAAVKAANAAHRRTIASRLTITLGDEFQGLVRSLGAGLTIMRDVRERLLVDGAECRFVLGLVRIDTELNPSIAWNMMGPGLARARERLGEKRLPSAYRFSLPRDAVLQTLLDAIGYSLTEVEEDWTDRQFELARAVRRNHEHPTAVAAELNLAPRTYYKIRRAARIEFYENQWNALKIAAADLDRRYKLA